jgi:hypothetical protein
VLLTRHVPENPTPAVELARIAALSWAEFVAFINGHETGRYRL